MLSNTYIEKCNSARVLKHNFWTAGTLPRLWARIGMLDSQQRSYLHKDLNTRCVLLLHSSWPYHHRVKAFTRHQLLSCVTVKVLFTFHLCFICRNDLAKNYSSTLKLSRLFCWFSKCWDNFERDVIFAYAGAN
jgi:hypothetical protein